MHWSDSKDNTGINGISFTCGAKPGEQSSTVIKSSASQWGTEGKKFECAGGYYTGAQLRVEQPKGSGDDTATNNVKMLCEGAWQEGDGDAKGSWNEAKECPQGKAICGIRTQVEPVNGDNTAVNQVAISCCPV